MDKCERDELAERAKRLEKAFREDPYLSSHLADTIRLFREDAVESNRPDAWWDLSDLCDDTEIFCGEDEHAELGGES